MHMPPAALASALTLLLAINAPSAWAQGTLDSAMSLYESAAYDDALAMLDRLPTEGLDPTGRGSIEHYKMLCLLALGRTAEAEGAIVALLHVRPTYRIHGGDASPRVMRVFTDVRRRALPGVADRRYQEARRLYGDRQYAQAAKAFAEVRALVADPDLAPAPARVANLGELAAGFEELSRAAMAAEECAAEAARSQPPAPPPAPADGIYSVADSDVVPPMVIRQDIRQWLGPVPRPSRGAPLGVIEIVIDETGAVIASAITTSVSAFYDVELTQSAKTWRYQPATKGGRPVKFRRLLSVLSR